MSAWLPTAIAVALYYLAANLITVDLAGRTGGMQFFWRLAGFVLSGAGLVGHVTYEHVHRRGPSMTTARHATVAVALGALALAAVANVHDWLSPAGYRPRMLVALAAWPAFTALPSFGFALVFAAGLRMMWPRTDSSNRRP